MIKVLVLGGGVEPYEGVNLGGFWARRAHQFRHPGEEIGNSNCSITLARDPNRCSEPREGKNRTPRELVWSVVDRVPVGAALTSPEPRDAGEPVHARSVAR